MAMGLECISQAAKAGLGPLCFTVPKGCLSHDARILALRQSLLRLQLAQRHTPSGAEGVSQQLWLLERKEEPER